jgi:hypothetical protein
MTEVEKDFLNYLYENYMKNLFICTYNLFDNLNKNFKEIEMYFSDVLKGNDPYYVFHNELKQTTYETSDYKNFELLYIQLKDVFNELHTQNNDLLFYKINYAILLKEFIEKIIEI